jgi:hypothetical protein
MLLDRLEGPETGHLLDKLVAHPALAGPERTLLAARLAQRRGDQDQVPALVREVLEELPGHRAALAFAAETGTPLPAKAARFVAERSEWDPTLPSAPADTAT